MISIIENLREKGEKPHLVLHACCGPCSSSVLERLCEAFLVTVFFYNPNIHPKTEHDRRLCELERFLKEFPLAKKNGVDLFVADYNSEDFFQATRVREEPHLQTEGEKGERCRRCYKFRMKKAAEFAKIVDAKWFTTTLSVSPYKDSQKINEIGKELSSDVKFLPSDFKKRGGFLRSTQLSDEFGLWRQDYCGCCYSIATRDKKNGTN